MRRRPAIARPLVVAGAVAVAAVMIGGMVWELPRERSAPQSLRMPDGTVFTLETVTFGREHKRTVVPLWQRLWCQFSRHVLRQPTPGPTIGYSSTNETLCLWIRETRPPGRSGFVGPFGFRLVDTQHQHWMGPLYRGSRHQSTNAALHFCGFPVFPRREKTLVVRYGYSLNSPSEFRIPNPAFRSYPVWQPEPLPAKRRDGDLEVTLSRFGVSFGLERPGRGIGSEAQAELDFSAPAPAVGNWWPVSATLWDATGNTATSPIHSLTRSSEDWVMWFQNQLWPGESAWRVRVEFSRADGYAPEDLWTLDSLPMPPPNLAPSGWPSSPAPIPAATNLHGCRARLLWWRLAAGGIRATPPSPGESRYSFAVELAPAAGGVRCDFVRMTDDQHRAFQLRSAHPFPGRAEFEVDGPTNAASVKLTLALHQSRFVAFMVKPELRQETAGR